MMVKAVPQDVLPHCHDRALHSASIKAVDRGESLWQATAMAVTSHMQEQDEEIKILRHLTFAADPSRCNNGHLSHGVVLVCNVQCTVGHCNMKQEMKPKVTEHS